MVSPLTKSYCQIFQVGWSSSPAPGTNGPRATVFFQHRWHPLTGTIAVLGRGPVWATDVSPFDRFSAVRDLQGHLSQGYRSVQMTPDCIAGKDPGAAKGWLRTMTAANVAYVPLPNNQTALRKSLHGKWRNRLKRAEAADLKVWHGPMHTDDTHWLWQKESHQRKTKRYAAEPVALSRNWVLANRKGSRLFTATFGGRIVAAMLFFLHSPGATYQIGWSGQTGRNCGAHCLLMWRAMCWLADNGYTGLELDLIDTVRAAGLARFKLGTGAKVIALGSTWLHAPGTRLVAKIVGRSQLNGSRSKIDSWRNLALPR